MQLLPGGQKVHGYEGLEGLEGIQRHNGHYVIPLPFRKSQLTMPNNRDQALKRAM